MLILGIKCSGAVRKVVLETLFSFVFPRLCEKFRDCCVVCDPAAVSAGV